MFEEHLYGVVVGPWQLLHQILNRLNFVFIIWHFYMKNTHKSVKNVQETSLFKQSCFKYCSPLTDRGDEVVEESISE